jgi:hypothetical protein
MKKEKESPEIFITRVEEGEFHVVLHGREPLIINRLAEKAKRELLMPKGRKSAAEKASSMKHNPLEEFRSSIYKFADPTSPTLLAIPSTAPKKAMAAAALDIPGGNKSQIGRLVWIPGELVGVYGTPKLFMAITRSADMNHTPDIRTRCIVPEWAIELDIKFVTPILNVTVVVNLLSAAGLYIGLGDWRPQKGSGSYGQFDVKTLKTAQEDPKVQELMKIGRKEQEKAMANPSFYNSETEELYRWWESEVKVRGKAVAA